MNKEKFIKEVEKLGLKVTPHILEQLDIYCDFLIEYNTHTNLTAIKDEDSIYLKHFYDSLTLTKVIDLNSQTSLLDIGTGAGFPGMVLKIFFPDLAITLVDSNNKKIKFLQELKEKLNVDKITIINNRIENITPDYLNYFDVVTSRAVTNLTVLTELSLPLVKKNKYFIPMKGSNVEEINAAMYAIEYLNANVIERIEFPLFNGTDFRTLLKVQKNTETKINDLRTYDKIIKKPLQKNSRYYKIKDDKGLI